MHISSTNIFKQYEQFKGRMGLREVSFQIQLQETIVAVVQTTSEETLVNLIAA